MSTIEAIKRQVREILLEEFNLVDTPSRDGGRVHLEVWENKRTGVPVALEMGHPTLVNIWLNRRDLPLSLPAGVTPRLKIPTDTGWTDENGDGANDNLKGYRHFFGNPIACLALTTMGDATKVLASLTRARIISGDMRMSRESRSAGPEAFLLKINGQENAPGGICRPQSETDWQGGTVWMSLEGKKPSYHYEVNPSPVIQSGDTVYIWTHETIEHGGGRGLTAKAIAAAVSLTDDRLEVVLDAVELLPLRIGFNDFPNKEALEGKLLKEVHKTVHLRCWYMSPQDRIDIDNLIQKFGSDAAARRAKVEADLYDPITQYLKENKDEVMAAEEARRTAVGKVRPSQQKFREDAMKRHNHRCVVTGFAVKEVLEAAHVIPHTGAPVLDVPENSLVLRRDIHALFDKRLICIDPKTSMILVSPKLEGTHYQNAFKDKKIDHKLTPELLNYQHRRYMANEKDKVLT